ncbi:hypothetical protein ACIBEF_06620 [Micromonospora sp. NPDC050795]|uniref:hypothetical protein n=1 Tax=Micromonospora sp. NPDC050795 TaxID=3364282 RepID=UPI0037AC3FDF
MPGAAGWSPGGAGRTHLARVASAAAPSGTVDFYAGNTHLGSAPVHHGVARLPSMVS